MGEMLRDRRAGTRVALGGMLGYARRLDHACFAVLGVGSALDLSRAGLRFVAYEAIPEGSRLDLELVLDGRPARVSGCRVVRVASRTAGSYEVAVEFEALAPLARITIERFVALRASSTERRAS